MRCYLDHNATSPLRPEARERWLEVASELQGNPSSLHAGGRRARDLVDRAREAVAGALGVDETEVIFTSGGTESNNLALRGVLAALPARPDGPPAGLVTTAVEHSSVLETARELGRARPFEEVGVDALGRADPEELAAAARRTGAALVAVQAASNEIGTLADLGATSAALARLPHPPLLFSDAVQALGRVPLALRAAGVDLASFSAHKLGGPVGVGVLWRRTGVALAPQHTGGGQEGGLRGGTEDVAGICAAARAIELAVAEQPAFAARARGQLEALWRELAPAVPGIRLVGPPLDDPERLPNTLAFLVPGQDGKVLVTRLDLEGLALGAGSACASGSLAPSHVLLALGLDEDAARAGLRVSLGRTTTNDDCAFAASVFRKLFSSPGASRVQGARCARDE